MIHVGVVARSVACGGRQAKPSEAAALTALARRSKAFWGYPEEFMRACADELTYRPEQIESGEAALTVGDVDGALGGFYAPRPVSTLEHEQEALFVESAWIGQGYGRALLNHATERVRSLGGAGLWVQGDPHAEGFPRALGGELIGTSESLSIPGRYLPLFRISVHSVRGA